MHHVGPLGWPSLDTMEACLGELLVIRGSCHGVLAAPMASRGGFGAKKILSFEEGDPQGDPRRHPTQQSPCLCARGAECLNVTWDVLKALGGRVLAAMVVWEPKVVRNDSGGLGGSLFRGLCLSAPCWTTWVAFLGHNGSLFG